MGWILFSYFISLAVSVCYKTCDENDITRKVCDTVCRDIDPERICQKLTESGTEEYCMNCDWEGFGSTFSDYDCDSCECTTKLGNFMIFIFSVFSIILLLLYACWFCNKHRRLWNEVEQSQNFQQFNDMPENQQSHNASALRSGDAPPQSYGAASIPANPDEIQSGI